MIDRLGLKKEFYLARIEKFLGKSKLVQESMPIYYFGNGYWRGYDVYAEDGYWMGIALINPSLSCADIETVERAINLLP